MAIRLFFLDRTNMFNMLYKQICFRFNLCSHIYLGFLKKLGNGNFVFHLASKLAVLQEVSRLLHGLNCGKPLELIALSANGKALSSEHDFDLQVRVDHFAVELMGN